MSLYQLQKLIYDVNRNPERRDAYRADKGGFFARYELTPEEQAFVRSETEELAAAFGYGEADWAGVPPS